MSTESRKLHAALLASNYAMMQPTGYHMSWELLDKSMFSGYGRNFIGYIRFTFTEIFSLDSIITVFGMYKGIHYDLRDFCDGVENSKITYLVLDVMTKPFDIQYVRIYYTNGVLCVHRATGNLITGEPTVVPYIMSKSEVLKLRLLADQIEELNFFILECE
jgi:hypothetical protein